MSPGDTILSIALVAFLTTVLFQVGIGASWVRRLRDWRWSRKDPPREDLVIDILRIENGGLASEHVWRYFKCRLCTTEWRDLLPKSADCHVECPLCGHGGSLKRIQHALRRRLVEAQQADQRRQEQEARARREQEELENSLKQRGRKVDL